MDKFPNIDIGFSSQNVINCTRVEPYKIWNEYIVNPCIGVSTIPNSTNIMPTHEFHSLLQKMNNEECLIFGDVMYQKNKNSNEPFHLFIIGGVGIGKNFTFMFLI